MDRERRDHVKDMARRYAQGVIESLETIWQFPELTDAEFKVMEDEIQRIAKRIGKPEHFPVFRRLTMTNNPRIDGVSRDDIELTQAALEACGYRVHLRERASTRWVTACKGLQVQYTHWHPLTNIHQAMQLLIDAPKALVVYVVNGCVEVGPESSTTNHVLAAKAVDGPTPADLINAQCRAIVTACASLKGVR